MLVGINNRKEEWKMKIKIERSNKEKIPKKKKERVVSVGKHRKMVLALWLLLSCSLAFGIYK
ncbi:TPA: conjugal transfer protein, partial [Enterococcus faecium]